MTKEEARMYAEELRRFIGRMSDGSACEIIAMVDENDPAIEVAPGETNWLRTLHYTTEIVDFCRGHKLDFWISAGMSDGKPYPYVHIF